MQYDLFISLNIMSSKFTHVAKCDRNSFIFKAEKYSIICMQHIFSLIQIPQEAGQLVCYSHLFQNFPQFVVVHTVKGFGIVNKAKLDVFLELSFFFDDPGDVDNLISVSSAFSKSSLKI